MKLNNKIVFITGASSGIGLATAEAFAKEKAKLILCARRLDLIEKLATELKQQYGTECLTFALDVSESATVQSQLKNIPEAWRHIDILVNNAGLAAGLDTLQDGDTQDWDAMIDVNIKGLLYVTKAILPGMLERDAGHIINIGSVAGHQVYPKGGVYCATKHAVKALSQGLRMDLLGSKLRVSSVDPGAVETNFSVTRFKGDATRAASVYEGFTPLSSEDIADAIVYCASRPLHVNVSEIIIMPTDQAAAHLISRK